MGKIIEILKKSSEIKFNFTENAIIFQPNLDWIVPKLRDITKINEEIRDAMKIDELEQTFQQFGDDAKKSLEEMNMQLQPEAVKKELLTFFNELSQKLQEFSKDVQEWDGQNQKVFMELIAELDEKARNDFEEFQTAFTAFHAANELEAQKRFKTAGDSIMAFGENVKAFMTETYDKLEALFATANVAEPVPDISDASPEEA